MLQRTLSRTGGQAGPRRWRPVVITVSTLVTVLAIYFALPSPGPRVRDVELSDDALTAELPKMIAPAPHPAADQRATAELGRKLFHDVRLSGDGRRACVTCHATAVAKVEADVEVDESGALDAPALINLHLGNWFDWDGRAPTLTAQALDAAEDPAQLASSRLHIVKVVGEHYRKDYEDAFGPWPQALDLARVPGHGAPEKPRLELPISVASQALATLGSKDEMRDVLETVQVTRQAPAMELGRRALRDAASPPFTWIGAFESLEAEARAGVQAVFFNVGRAVAAYESGIGAVDSPFDRFARRVVSGTKIPDALGPGFAAAELSGLKLFLGPGRCAACHAGPAFSDGQFHNIGLEARAPAPLRAGRATGVLRATASPWPCDDGGESCLELPYLDLENQSHIGAFKTPTLRNVIETAPYMHDGRFATLDDVLDHYANPRGRPAIGTREGTLPRVEFTAEERAALLAFLNAITAPVMDYGAVDMVGIKTTP